METKCKYCDGIGMTTECTEAPWQPNQYQYVPCDWCAGTGIEYADAADEVPAGAQPMTDDEWDAELATYAANEPARRARWDKMIQAVHQ